MSMSNRHPRKNASHSAAYVHNMAILMNRPKQVWERAVSPSCRCTDLHLESLSRCLAAYLTYVPASWQCSSHLQDMAVFIDDEKMCSGLRV